MDTQEKEVKLPAVVVLMVVASIAILLGIIIFIAIVWPK